MRRVQAGTVAVVSLLILLVVCSYANSFGNGFANDDHVIIVQNKLITQLRDIPTLFARDYWASSRNLNEAIPPPSTGLYRPFVMTTYALNYAVGGLNPFGYHVVNLFLHLLATCLVYLLALRLNCSPGGAFVAAAVFAVHPLHTEVVTGIVGRAELLMAASALGGLVLVLNGWRWATAPGPWRGWGDWKKQRPATSWCWRRTPASRTSAPSLPTSGHARGRRLRPRHVLRGSSAAS